VRDAVGWEEQAPDGAQLHVAWFDSGALLVTDVRDSQEDFERFFGERLAPAVEKAGIVGQPDTQLLPLHRRFIAPGVSGAA
jgi:hypothetical protein